MDLICFVYKSRELLCSNYRGWVTVTKLGIDLFFWSEKCEHEWPSLKTVNGNNYAYRGTRVYFSSNLHGSGSLFYYGAIKEKLWTGLLTRLMLLQRFAEWVMFGNVKIALKQISRNTLFKKTLKFKESSWKLTYYTASVIIAMLVTYEEPWFGNTDAFWHGWPHQTLKFRMKLFYTLQCGFYIYSVVALLFWETRRKDFSVMMSHHIITIGLISYSYLTGCFRVGSIVLALHDVSDVLLESAKLCKYSAKDGTATVLFGLFVLSWALLRLGYFPFWIIRSTSYEVTKYVDKSNNVHAVHYYVFNILLVTLLTIHIYWWILICRMISKQLQMHGRIPDDVRSDSEEE